MKPFVKYDRKTGRVIASGFVAPENLDSLRDPSCDVLVGVCSAADYVDVATATICRRKHNQMHLETPQVPVGGAFVVRSLPVGSALTVINPRGEPRELPIDAAEVSVPATMAGHYTFETRGVDTFPGQVTGQAVTVTAD